MELVRIEDSTCWPPVSSKLTSTVKWTWGHQSVCRPWPSMGCCVRNYGNVYFKIRISFIILPVISSLSDKFTDFWVYGCWLDIIFKTSRSSYWSTCSSIVFFQHTEHHCLLIALVWYPDFSICSIVDLVQQDLHTFWQYMNLRVFAANKEDLPVIFLYFFLISRDILLSI